MSTALRNGLEGDLRRIGFLEGAPAPDRDRSATGWFEHGLALTRPDLLQRCCDRLRDAIPDGCDRLAGAGTGSVALTVGLGLTTGLGLLLRDEAGHWSGDAFPGARVALVVDVLLTGGTAAALAADLRGAGYEVAGLVALLDRERAGRARLEADGIPVRALFTERELLAA